MFVSPLGDKPCVTTERDEAAAVAPKVHRACVCTYAWSLEELAREVGVSRSVLAERFLHFVGIPPIQYLAQWRITWLSGASNSGRVLLDQRSAGVNQCSIGNFVIDPALEKGVRPPYMPSFDRGLVVNAGLWESVIPSG